MSKICKECGFYEVKYHDCSGNKDKRAKMESEKVSFKSYDDYLSSKKWAQVKEDFKEFSDFSADVCFLCYSGHDLEFHHWRYPKDWNRDSYKNLIILCEQCHETTHSIEVSKDLHNSHLFKDNSEKSLIIYLSWLVKATNAMESAYFERLSNEF